MAIRQLGGTTYPVADLCGKQRVGIDHGCPRRVHDALDVNALEARVEWSQ